MISDIKLAIIEAARIAKSSKAKTVEKAEPEIDVPQFKTSRDRRAAEDKPVINDAVAEEIAEKDNDELEGQLSLDDVNGGAGGSEDYDDEYDDQYDDGYDEDYDDYDDEEPENESGNEENEIKVELAQNIKLPKRSVGFDKYSKKLKLNNENDSYDDDYDDYDDDYDDDDFDDYYREFDEEKRQERRVTIAAVITAFVIIGIIVFVGVKFFNVFENAAAVFNRTETVPKFVGMTMTDAEEQASSLGIRLIEGAVVDSTEPADTILTQDVEEGTEITDNMEIMVTVSSGADMYELPNVVGEQESDAISKITSALNANIIIEYEYDETHQEGEVIKQSPEGNTMVSASSDVVLTICRDQDSINAVVPKVEGYTEEEAIEKIEASGLTVGNISRTTSTSVASGYVITQTAEPGEEILKNSPIDIVVSIGRPAPQPVDNTPDTTTEDDTEPAPIGSDTTTDTGTTDQGATQTQPNTDNTGTSTDVADDVPALGSME